MSIITGPYVKDDFNECEEEQYEYFEEGFDYNHSDDRSCLNIHKQDPLPDVDDYDYDYDYGSDSVFGFDSDYDSVFDFDSDYDDSGHDD